MSTFWHAIDRSSMRGRFLSAAAIGLVAAVLCGLHGLPLGTASAQDNAIQAKPTATADLPEYLPRPSATELEILKALDKPVSFQFQASPLGEVVKHVSQVTGVNVVVDKVALEEEGVTTDTMLTMDLKDIRLGSGLRLLLQQLNLTYVFTNDVLKITSLTNANSQLITRVYPVADLCSQPEDYGELQDAMTQTVSPNSWSAVGGAGTVVPVKGSRSLVISQTRAVHDEILQLVRSLREARQQAGRKP